ncbi:MAG: hypothetical protein J2P28_02805 [Actinobacteria bacterium]|nr:hypothetical protein [Actinomycetota bacterium]
MPIHWGDRPRDRCLAFDGGAHRLVCGEPRCEAGYRTLCGLIQYMDYDEDEVPEEDR